MARKTREQRTLLAAHEDPSAEFVNSFKVSHRLNVALGAERKSKAEGQIKFLQKQREQQKYVEASKKKEKPPPDAVIEQQAILADLKRDARDSAKRAPAETPHEQEKRMAQRENFMASRKNRHDDACENFERLMDKLADACQEQAQDASKRMRVFVEETDAEIGQLLGPLETDTENLGEKTEAEVRSILAALEGVVEARRARTDDFSRELDEIDAERRDSSSGLLKSLVEAVTDAAHVVPGEIERIVEQKTMGLNAALLENQRSVKVLTAKLSVQTLRKSQEGKVRWHKGLLLWKQLRHRHTKDVVMARIANGEPGNEFMQPDALVEIVERLKAQQVEVFSKRKRLVNEAFSTPILDLVTGMARQWEDKNNALNDKAQEAYDQLLAELRDLQEELNIRGEEMLSELRQELEVHDARQEWGEHHSVADLVDADVRPPLKKCLDDISVLASSTFERLTKQEEEQHHVVSRFISFFQALARKQETLKRSMDMCELNYQNLIEDEEVKHAKTCEGNESQMLNLKDEIDEAAHQEDLDELKENAFDFLDSMAAGYEHHKDSLHSIHNEYPESVNGLFQQETENFSGDLGLATKEALEKQETPDPDPKTLKAWPQGSGSGCNVLEKLGLPELREKILFVPPPAEDPDAPPPAAEEPPPEPQEPQGDPVLADGSAALLVNHFEPSHLEESLAGTREKIFAHISTQRTHLLRIDVSGRCEQVSRDLDENLRRHTNRKGAVQVEWYVPRYATVAKHKDKFERHLVDIARKSQGHDEATETLHSDVATHEQAYRDELVELRGKLGEAETLPMLTCWERKAGDLAGGLKENYQRIKSQLLQLAHEAPDGLKKENDSFLKMCESGADQYSEKENKFYSDEAKECNRLLDERAKARMERIEEFKLKMDDMRKEPLKEFMEHYNEAVEQLSAAKGYRKHGEPRRKAQERYRALVGRASTVKRNVGDLFEYFDALCKLPLEGPIDVTMLPRCPLFQLGDFFKKSGTTWVLTSELVGVFNILVCALNALGEHLDAFKSNHAADYKLEKVRPMCVLREEERTAPSSEANTAQEQSLRNDCLGVMLGQLKPSETFETEIQSIVKAAQDHYGGMANTPDFMKQFLEEMQASAERACKEVALGVRDSVDGLRDDVLLRLGDALFGELATRSIRELRRRTREAQESSEKTWKDNDAKREGHERRLNPGLANPNAEEELNGLIKDEKSRFQAATALNKEDRAKMVAVLREQANTFVGRMTANFECAIQLLDDMPLHAHFKDLPGDDQVEPPRMSIKRRMRRLKAPAGGGAGDVCPQRLLPKRTWEGFQSYECRKLLMGSTWPPDEELAEAAEDVLAKLTPEVCSYRSPVHKELFRQRNAHYDRYRLEFSAEVKQRGLELVSREEQEMIGARNWLSMVKQLKGGELPEEEEEEERPPTPVPEVPPPAPAKGGKKK